jgi:hypothetical protein
MTKKNLKICPKNNKNSKKKKKNVSQNFIKCIVLFYEIIH